MKFSNYVAAAAAVAAGTAVFGIGDSFALRDRPMARSVQDVRFIELEANQCREGVTNALSERGFLVTDNAGDAQAILELKITSSGRNLDDVPGFGGVGNRASYAATLVGAHDRVLYSTSGSEGSVTMAEMCADIGDEIGDRLKSQRG